MAANPIVDYVQRESGRIVEWAIRRAVFPGNPLVNLIPRATWPQGMGEDLNVITYERSAPAEASPTWTQIATVDGNEGGSCLPSTDEIPTGSTKRTFYLYRKAVEGPDFCAEDLRSAGGLSQQLSAIGNSLGGYIRLLWELHDQSEYFKQCKYKVIVTSDACPPPYSDSMDSTWDAAADSASVGTSCPGSMLTQGILDYWRWILIRDGAATSAMGMEDGNPILTLLLGPETSEQIKKQNSTLRTDIRYAKPPELLAPYGVSGSWKGFYHLIVPFPRRWTCTGGAFTQVAAWTMSAASKGQKAEVNSSWRTAPYEETFIFDRSVMRQLIPNPITNPAEMFNFNPVNYVGKLMVKNIPDREKNPDENILYHRAVLAAASEPVRPEMGVAFMHLRCDPACELVTSCTT